MRAFTKINLHHYDKIIVTFSGGKDSTATFLHLLKEGVSPEKIELWHHDVDGREGSDLMDWPVTADYCRKFAQHFNVPIYFSWKMGGFEGEMLRKNALTAPTKFETPKGLHQVGGTRGKKNTRLKFPQVSSDLKVRWCSPYLKIDIGSTAIRNQERFNHSKTLVISGERGEESTARSKYQVFEPDRADNRDGKSGRHVDRYRPVLHWKEQQVWSIIEEFKVRAHPAYYLGWGRVSCAACIFGSPNQWASVRKIMPERFERIENYEKEFGCTIARNASVTEKADKGKAYAMPQSLIEVALNREYTLPIQEENWQLPSGAFGESCGPT